MALVSVGLDDVPLTLAPGYVPLWAAPEGRNGLQTGRSTSLGWQGQDGPISRL